MRLILTLLMIVQSLAPASELEWRFETRYAEMLSTRRRPPSDWQLRSAAIGNNEKWELGESSIWHIELQREGANPILSGLCYKSDESLAWGFKIFDWAQQQMQADGSFNCDDAFHSTSLYVESLARSLLLLQASHHPQYAPKLKQYGNRLLQSAHWLASAKQTEISYQRQRQYNHRRFLLAAALGETGMLVNDVALLNMSETYLRDGMSLQRADGVFPEKGGHDTGYHAVSLIFAQRCLNTFAPAQLRAELDGSIANGIQWLKQRVNPDGSIITAGNTRTGELQERTRHGKYKIVEPHELARALLYRFEATHEVDLHLLASRVLDYAKSHPRP